MSAAPQAFPLQWPAGKPRTPAQKRERAKFGKKGRGWTSDPITGGNRYEGAKSLTVADAVARVQGELRRLGATHPVISTNIELRRDGLPYSKQPRLDDDPGAAVYFQLKGKPIVLACDHYDRVADNAAAIAAHVDAMRAIERHGVGSLEQMFAGFAALPPISPDDWREPLGHPSTLDEAERNYRERMKYAHPDVGGNEAVAARLNAAIAKAREELAA
ncbi:MAG TPA: J domain-containing protein [Candidatus Baltobacteraceae bacterium]|nr:J domain-containing protein [Candidatus Baltobacteraceae bacterium]